MVVSREIYMARNLVKSVRGESLVYELGEPHWIGSTLLDVHSNGHNEVLAFDRS